MNVQVEKKPDGEAVLTIEVAVSEMQPELQAAAQRLSKQMKVAGFRPGHVPYDVVKNTYGELSIYEEATERIVAKHFVEAVRQHSLQTVGQPEIKIEKLAPDNPFIFTATTALLPTVTLGDYRKIKKERKPVTVDPKEIEKALTTLQEMRGSEVLVERPAQKGDKVEIDLDIFMDKVPLDGGKSQKHPIRLGQGHFLPGFEDQLIGLTAGQTKEFPLPFPKDYHKKDLQGKTADFRVKMAAVYEVKLPVLDDAFAKAVGKFEKLGELRQAIEENLYKEQEEQSQRQFELAIIEDIVRQSTFGLFPGKLVKAEVEKMLAELEHDVTANGMKVEEYLQSIRKTKDQLREDFKPQAEKRLKVALVIRHIAEAEKIEATREEIEAETQASLDVTQDPKKQKAIDSDEYRRYVRTVLINRKVFELLAKIASAKE